MSSITNLISVGVNGTGTANSVMKWLDADTATDSIIYDNGTSIGIGTSSPTPSADTAYNNIQIGQSAVLSGYNSGASLLTVGENFYWNAGWKYLTSGPASIHQMNTGTHSFRVASSGAADGSLTWISALDINNSGNVGIGTSSPSDVIDVQKNQNATTNFYFRNTDTTDTNSRAILNVDAGNVGLNLQAINGDHSYVSSSSNLYVQAASQNIFFAGGAERMRIDSSGNVGIGTSSPAAKIDISNEVNATAIGDSILTVRNTRLNTGSGAANIRFITNEVGAGIQDNRAQIGAEYDGANGGRLIFSTAQTSTKTITERMRITSGGDVLIGTTSSAVGYAGGSGIALKSSGQISFARSGASENVYIQRDTTGRFFSFYYGNLNSVPTGVGQIETNGSSTSYVTSSDYRLKENVVPMSGALDRVDALKPSRFNFIADPEKTVDGFLAHEVQEVVPEAITGEKDGMREEEYEVEPAVYEEIVHPAEEAILDEEGNVIQEAKEEWTEKVLVSEAVMGTRLVPEYQGIDQSKLVPLLVGAIQELKARIEILENK